TFFRQGYTRRDARAAKLALAQGKRVIIVGPRENVVPLLAADCQIFATWNKTFATIRRQHTLCKETRQLVSRRKCGWRRLRYFAAPITAPFPRAQRGSLGPSSPAQRSAATQRGRRAQQQQQRTHHSGKDQSC